MKKNTSISIIILTGIFYVIFGSANLYAAKEYGDGEECLKCHADLWEKAMQKFYVHKPFFEKKCKLCHIEDAEGKAAELGFKTDNNVEWLETQRENIKTHWFELPREKVADLILVDIQEAGQGNQRQEIKLTNIEDIKILADDKNIPEISNVRVVNIERGLFLNVTIAWDTDKLSSSQVVYGRQQLDNESTLSRNMTNKHMVILPGLKPKSKYKFKVVSTDYFGNKAESKLYGFSTKVKSNKKTENKDELKYPKGLIVKHQLYRTDEKILIKFASNKPTLIAVGVPKAPGVKEASFKTTGEKPVNHNLKDAITTNSKICEPCHGVYTKKSNHPINVPPKPGMTIPEDYFVLANGNITCMTCHASHSSDIEYRMLKPSKRELCIGCHVTKM